jgi:hypothetical protein
MLMESESEKHSKTFLGKCTLDLKVPLMVDVLVAMKIAGTGCRDLPDRGSHRRALLAGRGHEACGAEAYFAVVSGIADKKVRK